MSLLRQLPLLCALHVGFGSPAPVSAAPGDFDTTFHGTGWISFPLPGVVPYPFPNTGILDGMAVQSDGKIVIGGHTSGGSRLAGYRLRPDASLDPSFNGTGFVLAPPQFATDFKPAFALQDDGKPVLALVHFEDSLTSIIRYLPDGSPDTAFGNAGGSTSTGVPGGYLGVGAIALQKDGKMIVSIVPHSVLRYHANGLLDVSFGDAGRVALNAVGNSLAVQYDGKILVGCEGPGLRVLRLNPDGTPDLTFGISGLATLALNGSTTLVDSLVPMRNGRILAGGTYTVSGSLRDVIARLLPDGTPDTTFNGTGWKGGTFAGSADSFISGSILVQNNGKVIFARDPGFARFNPDGTLDAGFGSAGKVENEIPASAAVLLPDGKLLTAGNRFESAENSNNLVVARYQTGIVPGIHVEEPAGSPLLNGPDTLDFGLVTVGSRTKEFTIRNLGSIPLTNISVSLTGQSHPGEFLFNQPAAATLAPGAQTTFLVTFTPSSTPGPRTATLNIASSDADDNPFLIPVTGARATPVQVWRITYFGSPDNSGPGADLNDFDRDGLVNLMEYATGNHPHQPSPSPSLVKNGNSLEFTYTRSVVALSEFSYQPESAASPAGPWSPANITSNVLSDDGAIQWIRATAPAGGGARFLRLRVTRL